MLLSMGIRRSTPHHFSKAVYFELNYWEQCGIAILAYHHFKKYRLLDSNKIAEWSRKALSVTHPLCTEVLTADLLSSLCRRYDSTLSRFSSHILHSERWEKWCLSTTVHNGRAVKLGDSPNLSQTAFPGGKSVRVLGRTSRNPTAFSRSL